YHQRWAGCAHCPAGPSARWRFRQPAGGLGWRKQGTGEEVFGRRTDPLYVQRREAIVRLHKLELPSVKRRRFEPGGTPASRTKVTIVPESKCRLGRRVPRRASRLGRTASYVNFPVGDRSDDIGSPAACRKVCRDSG